jgi:hypothetical protein
MAVELLLNYSRVELRREGYAKLRRSKTLQVATWDGSHAWPDGGFGRWRAAEMGVDESGMMSESLWRDPETGILMLTPSCLRSDWMSNPGNAGDWWNLGDLDTALGALTALPQTHLGAAPDFLTTSRDGDDPVQALPGVPPDLAALDVAAAGLTWVARTKHHKRLRLNEGFGVMVTPAGIAVERDTALFAYGWDRWFLIARASGQAAIYYRWGTLSEPNWSVLARFEYVHGGAAQVAPFFLSLIPWGPDCFSILHTSMGGAQSGKSDASSATTGMTLFQAQPLGLRLGHEIPYDAANQQWVKHAGGDLWFAVPSMAATTFAASRLRYRAAQLTIAPEPLQEPRSGLTPTVTPLGYYPLGTGAQRSSGDPTPGCSIANHDNLAWIPGSHTDLVARTYLVPDSDGKWTPEVSAVLYEIDAATTTLPAGSEIDLSDRWRRLSFSLSADGPGPLTAIVTRPVSEFPTLLGLRGPIRLTVDGLVVFEGMVDESRPKIEGSWHPRGNVVITDDLLATDAATELEYLVAGSVAPMLAPNLGRLMEIVFARFGIPSGQQLIADELYAIAVNDEQSGEDYRELNDSATFGDLRRRLIADYAMQDRQLRIRRYDAGSGPIWWAYLTTAWTSDQNPDWIFYLDSRALPEGLETDAQRWAAGWLRLTSEPEWTIRRPQANAIRTHAASRSGQGAAGYSCHIAPDPRAFVDGPGGPLDPFDRCIVQPRVRAAQPALGDSASESTIGGLARFARRRYEEIARPQVQLLSTGEWRGNVAPDDRVMVLTVAPCDGPDYEAGDIVSLGCWAIEAISIDMAYEEGGEPVEDEFGGLHGIDRSWSRSASYTLGWLGATASEDYPIAWAQMPEEL